MAHKDYVARGRAAKKNTPPPASPLPWLTIIITLLVLAAFAGGLWMIKDKAPEQTQTQTEKTEAKTEKDPLPTMEEEEWEFITTLPDQTVEVEVEERAVSDKEYLMQCGSFRRASQAEEMKAKIAFQGLEAQVRESNGSNGLWHRVILGPYATKRAAEKDKHTLRRIDITTCQIWLWNL